MLLELILSVGSGPLLAGFSLGLPNRNKFNNLWLQCIVRDDSGQVSLWMTEKALLKWTKNDNATDFENKHTDNSLRLPFYSSIKILRRPSTANNANGNLIDCFVVDADEQDTKQLPSRAVAMLLPMADPSLDSVLPGTLGMIRKAEHSPLSVQYISQELIPELANLNAKSAGAKIIRPCCRVIVLVKSFKRSSLTAAGETGHQVVTEDVVDFIETNAAGGTQEKYKLTAFCNLENLMDFKLDPPKSGQQKASVALVSVTGIIAGDVDSAGRSVNSFLVDDVALLDHEQANALRDMQSKQLYYAAVGGQMSRKRPREPWSPHEHPGNAKVCRTLGRSPTDELLPNYSFETPTKGDA